MRWLIVVVALCAACSSSPSKYSAAQIVDAVDVSPTDAGPPPRREAPAQRCCKVCHEGKACGDSCISASKTCHKSGGCACDG